MVAQAKPDFFISYNKADKAWAEWIAWELEEVGYLTSLQAWDFRPGHNFVLAMQRSATQAERTLAVLSPDFLQSIYCQPEWAAAFAADPAGIDGKLMPVRVRDCQPEGLLAQIIYIDLVGLSEAEARARLRAEAQRGRAKPLMRPLFPAGSVRQSRKPPFFPGNPPPAPSAYPPQAIAAVPLGTAARTRRARAPRKLLIVAGLFLLVSLAVLGAVALRSWAVANDSLDAELGVPADEPLPNKRGSFELAPQLSWLTSASWTPGGHGLIMIGDSPGRFHLYPLHSADGRRLTALSSGPLDLLNLEAPAYIARKGRGYLLYSNGTATRLLSLDSRLQIADRHDLEVTSSLSDELHLTGVKGWVTAGDDVVAIGDMALGDLEEKKSVKWMSWLIRFPLAAPARFTKIDEIVTDRALPYTYRMVYPHLAALGDTAYFLNMHGPTAPSILAVADKEWLGPGEPSHLGFKDFQQVPDYSGSDKMGAYRIFESAATVAAIYGWKDYLYLLLKCPTPARKPQPTEWFVTKMEPHSMRPLHTVSIPADSPHLTVVPGDPLWALIEKGKPYEPSKGREAQPVSHLIVVPAAEIESADSASVLRGSQQPRCNSPGRAGLILETDTPGV